MSEQKNIISFYNCVIVSSQICDGNCKFFYDTRPDNGMFFYFDAIIYLHMAYGSADVNAIRVLFHSYIQIK